MSEIIGDKACPKCREKGRDKTGNHLILFKDGGSYCSRCQYTENEGTFSEPNANFGLTPTKEECISLVKKTKEDTTFKGLKDRGLRQETLKHFGIKVSLSESDGESITAVYFPTFKEGEHLGYKVRYPNKNFGTIGDRKNSDFVGADVCPKKGNKIFITEGEYDMCALYQTIYDNCKPEWRHSIAVVSLLNGAKSVQKELLRNSDLLSKFKDVVLVLDNDEEGKNASEKAVQIIGVEKAKVVTLPLKDANSMLLKGRGKELYFNCITENSVPRPEKVISGNEISMEDLRVPLKKGLETPYPMLNEKLGGFRYGDGGGELTVVCAGSGMGKTTLAREIVYDFNANHKLKLGHIFLEEQFRKTGQAYIAMDNNVPVASLRADPNIITEYKFKKSYEKLIANNRTSFLTHFGSLASDNLLGYLKYLGIQEENDFIVLDHISMVVSGQENSHNGERKDIDILMTKLAAFCEDTGVSVIAIVHLKRPPKGSFNEGGRVSLSDLRGSAAIEQLSHNIISVEGDQQGDNPNERTIRVLKNREWGKVGKADLLHYNTTTGRLLPLEYPQETEEDDNKY